MSVDFSCFRKSPIGERSDSTLSHSPSRGRALERSGRHCFSLSTFGSSMFSFSSLPSNAFTNAFLNTLRIVVITSGTGSSKLPDSGTRPEPVLRVIANDSGQPADDALPDKIDWVIAVVRRIEDRHVIEDRLDVAGESAVL